MNPSSNPPVHTLDDMLRFESAMPIEQRLPGRSVYDVFVASARRHPERTAITMLMSGAPDEQPRQVSYTELLNLVRRAANLFTSLGGERPGVAYMLPSLVETHATLWGAETSGYAVPINFLLQPEHIAELLKASGARILVALGPHPQLDIWQKALQLREQLPGLTLLRVAAPGVPLEPGVLDWHTALMAESDDQLRCGQAESDDAVAAYFHTGGTTGTPKLVAHTHRGQLAAALGGAVLAQMTENDALTATLPLFHVGGTIFCGLSPFMAGTELIIMSPGGLRNPAMVKGFWQLAERHGATLVGGVPTSMGVVVEQPLDGIDISRVRAGFTGAALLPVAVGERFRKLTGKGLHEVYGMTEASGLIAVDPTGSEGGIGSVGLRLPYTEVMVRRLAADGSLGEACAPEEIGVLTVRGPTVSPGYRNPEHNTGVFEDGMLITGDLAFLDGASRIHIAGRSKDLIIRSGHNIDPLMIENTMTNHPAVALAAAVGMPDAYAGELPVCYVALSPGAAVTETELQTYAQQAIAERPAWPRHIHIVDSIPLTSVGKIYKPQLRCDAAARLVTGIVQQQMGLAEARVQAEEGGPRGMRVTVTLSLAQQSSVAPVQEALKPYLFESKVSAV